MDIPTKCFAIVIGSGPNGLYALSKLQKTYPNKEVFGIDKGEVLNNFYVYPNVRFHSTIKELGFDNYKYTKHELDYKPDTLDMIDYYLSFKEATNFRIAISTPSFPNIETIFNNAKQSTKIPHASAPFLVVTKRKYPYPNNRPMIFNKREIELFRIISLPKK